MKNDYYDIACNDLLYLQATLHLPFYNSIAPAAQQVAEKMIKSVAELTCMGIEKLMQSHNLRALYDEIHQVEPDFVLGRSSLAMLKDFYFEARYPGDNFVTVTKEDCAECLETMYQVVEQVNNFRKAHDLPVMEIQRMELQS